MRISRGVTQEERIAKAMCKLVSDLYVDLDMLGYYMYRSMPPLMYNRIQEAFHAAEHEKQMQENPEYRRTMNELGI
jgi:hypothetical protein